MVFQENLLLAQQQLSVSLASFNVPQAKHELRATEARQQHQRQKLGLPQHLLQEGLNAVQAQDKTNHVCCYQQHDVECRCKPGYIPEHTALLVAYTPRLLPHPLHPKLWCKQQSHKPSPAQQPQLQVVPYGHKREDQPNIQRPPGSTAQWDIHVAHKPLVEAGVPVLPEPYHVVVVADAARHVFWHIYPVSE